MLTLSSLIISSTKYHEPLDIGIGRIDTRTNKQYSRCGSRVGSS